ncbi:hypothetical protein B0A49_08261 [Cryomyces minteri]|uniref:Elongation factor 1-beta n=1 Tax=Cryomyces minteri TaxID=331657 RepID=A0A4U0WMY4_9PEZI|nr:hypothetical protein B0A49_08261 [Cryomyces minteri]
MGFTDFDSESGLTLLNNWVKTRSYVNGYEPSQADVKCFQAIKTKPDSAKLPHAARWYKHIASFESEFSSLPGDPSKPHTAYGPDSSEVTVNTAKGTEKDLTEEDDEDVDLFGSDDEEEDAEAARIRDERLAEYKKKKEGKTKPAAKSVVTLAVKPWDDETDMKALEAAVRSIEQDGLVWGASKLVPIAFGVKALQINLVIEDDKVSLDELQDKIAEDEDHVQSSDVMAMQKL